MIEKAEHAIAAVSRVFIYGSAAAIAVMAGLVTYSTLARYFAGNALSITEELAAFLLVTCVFLALPHAAMEGQHIKLTIFTSRLSGAALAWARLATHATSLFFFVVLTFLTYEFAKTGFMLGSRTETGGILEAPWRTVLPVTSAWMCVVLALFCVKDVAAIVRRDPSLASQS